MFLVCISPIISDAEHLFMYLLAIFISSWKKCVQILCPLIRYFFLLSCMISLYISDTDVLSDTQFANIFPFILLTVSFVVKMFSFDVVPSVYFAFVTFAFGVKAINHPQD